MTTSAHTGPFAGWVGSWILSSVRKVRVMSDSEPDFFGVEGVKRNAATISETPVCMDERGKDNRPLTKPPSAWHAWMRRGSVIASRLQSTEGSKSTKEGMNISGW